MERCPAKMFLRVAVIVFLSFMGIVNSARILAILPSPSPSHQIWNRALIRALTERGHEMTVLSPDDEVEKIDSKREIHLEDTLKVVNLEFLDEELANKNSFGMIKELWDRSIQLCRHQLHTNGARELMEMPSSSFDLILIETMYNDCFNLYIHHFGGGTKIPVVGLTAIGTGPWTDTITGLRTLPSVTPIPFLSYSNQMNVWQRFLNFILTGITSMGMSMYYFPGHQKIAEEVYGALPPLSELGRNISIVIANNHYILNGAQQNMPTVIEVAGMHCGPSKTLPLNLLGFANGASKGIIYLSFGSSIHSHKFPKTKIQSIIDAFSSIGPKIRVLWNYDSSTPLEGLPSNVMVQKWLPQEDILGHPKTLLSITHGGSLSIQEAIFHGIPIIGIPFNGHQERNIRTLASTGAAIHLDFESLTKESLVGAIQTILRDTSFRRKMHKLSIMFRDRPENPLDKALFWTEFTLRHGKGRLEQLRSASMELSWYAYYLLDILFIMALFSLLFIWSIVFAFYKLRDNYFPNKKISGSFKPSKKRK